MLADGLEACKVWIKESVALQRQLVASVIATNGPIERMEFSSAVDYTPEVMAAVEALVSGELKQAVTIAGKHERNAATDAAAEKALVALCAEGSEFEGQERAVKDAVRSLTKKLVRRGSSRRASASTAVACATCGRCRPRSACCRPPTARACSSVARHR